MTLARPALRERQAPPAFAEVYAQHASFVWRAVRRLGVSDADSADAAQQVFLVVHQRLADFDGRAAISSWLFGICLRVAADWRKKAHVRREVMVAEPPDAEVSAQQEEQVAQRQARRELDRILELLDEKKRAVFVLFELEQWPMAEVADAVDVPLQTAYARLYAAREIVERELARRGGR